MKKILMTVALAPMMALANVEKVGDIEWSYDIIDGYASISTTSIAGVVTIPSELGGYTVTTISASAFEKCSELTEVTIPASITTIGADAFYRCSSLVKVTFGGDEPASVDEDAFYKVSEDCAVYVTYGTTWSCTIPGTWHDMPIRYPPHCDETLVATADKKDGDSFKHSTTLTLSVQDGCTIYYTTDGSEPTTNSALYATPIAISETTTIKYFITDALSGNWSPVYSLTLTREATNPLYCVIDLSAGPNAKAYPVTYMNEIPAGGWTDEYKTNKLVLRCIEPGTFIMGDETTSSSRVTLTNPFYIGIFEVTQKQWMNVMGYNPSYYQGNDMRPIENIAYSTACGDLSYSFMNNLLMRTGLDVGIPTEAQWEYACRAGTTTKYSYGDSEDVNYMWCANNSESITHPVGTRIPNPWGLYDMHGNVAEVCRIGYDNITDSATVVYRGGTYAGEEYYTRSDGEKVYIYECSSFYKGSTRPISQIDANGARGIRVSITMTGAVVTPVTISYEANGGSCVERSQNVASGSALNALPTPVRYGFTFDGWYTAPVGGEKITTVTSDTIAYAHWTHNDVYIVADGMARIGDGKTAAIDVQTTGTVTIPASYGGYPTTTIAGHAFEQCGEIVSVDIPDSVTEIGDSAFERCYSLTNITIPASVTNIGYCAFRDCFRLAEVKFLGNRPHIDLGAFLGVPAYAVISSKEGRLTAVLPTEVNGDVVSIPEGWLDEVATRHRGDTPAGYDSYEEAFAAKYGSDRVKALAKPTGKRDTQGNPMMVWQDYVAGTDPLDEEDVFRATVTLEDGVPVVHWAPELTASQAALREYKIFAKTALKDAEWTDVTSLSDAARQEAGYQFFKVTVRMR